MGMERALKKIKTILSDKIAQALIIELIKEIVKYLLR
jgi:hypothetical protein